MIRNFTVTDNVAVRQGDYSPFNVTAPLDFAAPRAAASFLITGLYDVNTNKAGQAGLNNFFHAGERLRESKSSIGTRKIEALTVNARLKPGGTAAGWAQHGPHDDG